MDNAEKVRENRARRMATRQRLQLVKSRRRDPNAYDFGGYMLVHLDTNIVAFGGDPWVYALSIKDVEEYLTRRP